MKSKREDLTWSILKLVPLYAQWHHSKDVQQWSLYQRPFRIFHNYNNRLIRIRETGSRKKECSTSLGHSNSTDAFLLLSYEEEDEAALLEEKSRWRRIASHIPPLLRMKAAARCVYYYEKTKWECSSQMVLHCYKYFCKKRELLDKIWVTGSFFVMSTLVACRLLLLYI